VDMIRVAGSGEYTVHCDNCDKQIMYPFEPLVPGTQGVVFCNVNCMEYYRRKNPEFTPMAVYMAQHRKSLISAVIPKRG
jgi:hypothetical protein